ncbi:MAG: hypothetical protein Q9M91_07690 [Candidatus Dojkabacteria bacterium]|nr:hypothetical protein [Candidatus Dojkabacteria bacterium]MDQ7021668.1 hypothetical protein [Candidatus Dojkabacteria bacterium]
MAKADDLMQILLQDTTSTEVETFIKEIRTEGEVTYTPDMLRIYMAVTGREFISEEHADPEGEIQAILEA